jgi:hypothetical protein
MASRKNLKKWIYLSGKTRRFRRVSLIFTVVFVSSYAFMGPVASLARRGLDVHPLEQEPGDPDGHRGHPKERGLPDSNHEILCARQYRLF